MHKAQTAILLFSRSLEAEFRAKSFGLTRDRFRQLYTALVRKTRQTLDGVTAPVFEFDSHQQVGSEFGERLINAIKEVQKKGFDKVIVVGNDAPGLNPEILNVAIQSIGRGKNVLGRDSRGGCYLMGFDLNHLDLNAFYQIEWHSRRVFDQVNSLLQADTSLPQLADLNHREDLKAALLVKTSPRSYIVSLFKLVFSSFFKAFNLKEPIKEVSSLKTHYRGPPGLVFITSY
ncbi:MAG: DUF2064 domain-containing protein [Roseivirga sp.]|nr:DUF2064 domain-containing protein [Roseivirga sp.]